MAKVKNEKTDGIITVSQGVPVGSREDETDWGRLHAMTEEDIERNAREDPDTLCLEDCDLTQLQVVTPTKKKQISLRMDGDVVDWFQSLGKGMNAVLRASMEARKQQRIMSHFQFPETDALSIDLSDAPATGGAINAGADGVDEDILFSIESEGRVTKSKGPAFAQIWPASADLARIALDEHHIVIGCGCPTTQRQSA